MVDRIRIAAALSQPNVKAFLAVIRVGEGTPDPDGYLRHFGGKLFDSYVDHPRVAITAGLGANKYTSTAAGAYQFLAGTWDECARAMGLSDFSPASQDLAAVFLIDRRGALDDVLSGRIEQAITKCNREWASLPGSPYGQPTKTMAQAVATYKAHGGATSVEQSPPAPIETIEIPKERTAMAFPALLAALLPSLIESIPKLATIFKPGSAVAERNVQAASIAFDIAKTALSASNEQEVIERIKSDPAAAATVSKAVEANWFQLVEVGGGIEAAHKRNAEASDKGWRAMVYNPALFVTVLLLPLVYMTVWQVLTDTGWSGEIKASVVSAIVSGLLFGIVGFWLGTSSSSARKTELMAPGR